MQFDKLMMALGLGEVTGEPCEVKGGLLHKMYKVVTASGVYAVKVLNGEIMKRPEALMNTVNSERIAEAFGGSLPVIGAVKIDGKHVHEIDGTYYMVFRWVEGSSVFAPDINEVHCRAIGDVLGRIHAMNISVAGVVPEADAAGLYEWERYIQLAKERELERREWFAQYEKALDDIIAWNKAVCGAQITLGINMVISHRDLDPKNVMWNNEQPLIIDWEAAGYVNPYQELLEVINYWADDGCGINKEYFKAIIEAYSKYVSLKGAEWDKVLAGSMAGMLGWLEYNVKRALGIEASDDKEVQMGEEQVTGTIKELYNYQNNGLKCILREILGQTSSINFWEVYTWQ